MISYGWIVSSLIEIKHNIEIKDEVSRNLVKRGEIISDGLFQCSLPALYIARCKRSWTYVVGQSAYPKTNWSVVERLLLKPYTQVRFPVGSKSKTIKIGVHSFPAWRSATKRYSAMPPLCVVDRWAGGNLTRRPRKVPSLSPGLGNLMNQDVITIAIIKRE